MINKILAATHNIHKLAEIREVLRGIEIESLKDVRIDIDIEENGSTFFENALIKAKAISEMTGKVTLSDDSGLIIDALSGKPGINSARYAGLEGNDQLNRQKVLKDMEGIKNRKASFHTTVVLYCPSGKFFSADGQIKGEITTEERGENGFGYDSIFLPDRLQLTLAEISLKEKNVISHRKIALTNLLNILNKR